MKERLKKALPILGVVCGACLVAAAIVLGEQVPEKMSGVFLMVNMNRWAKQM